MTTTGERLVTLSELLTVETAMVHYLAIDTSGTGGGTVVVGEFDIEFEEPIQAVIGDNELVGVIEDDGIEVEIEDDEIEVEFDDDGLTGETC